MVTVQYGRTSVQLALGPEGRVEVGGAGPLPVLEHPGEAVAAALEAPIDFPPLRRALTPADHVVLVVDERLPRLADLVTPVLAHLNQAGVEPANVTVLSPAGAGGQRWIDDLPEDYEDVRLETHDAADRKKLSYLATTKSGRRVYLNRTLVEADQVVVLGRPDVDAGAAGAGLQALYPTFAGGETVQALRSARGAAIRAEAAEVAWLLGVPFLVQVIEGPGDSLTRVVAGPPASAARGEELYHQAWDRPVTRRVETVVAAVREPGRGSTFADLARALVHASRLVEPGGKVVLLTEARPELSPGASLLRRAPDPGRALALLAREDPDDRHAAADWAGAAQAARVYLLSGLPAGEVEELFVTPLDDASQTRRLVESSGSWLVLENADKALPRLVKDEANHG